MIRIILAAAMSLACATSAAAATLTATPSTIAATIAAAQPGDTINLSPGTYAPIKITRTWSRPITINASRSIVRGVTISGGGVDWQSGTIVASGGLDGAAAAGYAAQLVKAAGVRFEGVTFTDAKMAVVIAGGSNIEVVGSRFTGLRSDGVNATAVDGLTIEHNVFDGFLPRPTTCTAPIGVTTGLSAAVCKLRAGVWADGDHPDGAQIRNGATRVRVRFNVFRGPIQGGFQMEGPTDKPLSDVVIEYNDFAVSTYHTATLTTCSGCFIRYNLVRRIPGSTIKAVIRAGTARRCENDVADDKPDGACSTVR